MSNDPISVIVAMDFSDEIMEQLRLISPRFRIERHFPKVPENLWQDVEILYSSRIFPTPKQAPKLRWIQLHSAGMEHATGHPIIADTDIPVTSASGIHAVTMAEFTIGMMIAWEYKFRQFIKDQDEKRWRDNKHIFYAPRQLRGLTVGIAGYGTIGRELARMADALGMVVLASKNDVMHPADHVHYIEPGTGDPDAEIPERIYPSSALASMARDCDYLVLLMPMTEENRKIVNAGVFDAMRDNAVLINLARGGLVDEHALIEALKKRKIGGAILDVFENEPLPKESPLWEMDNVIITPHVAGNNSRYHELAAAVFAENLQRYLERHELLNKLDRHKGY